MKAKKDKYVLRAYYDITLQWKVEGLDIRTMFEYNDRPPAHLSRNLKLSNNIIAGGELLSLNNIEIYNCDLYKARRKR